jgi:hypothetical protein
MVCRVDPVGSGYGPVAGFCKYDDEPAGSVTTELVMDKEAKSKYKKYYKISVSEIS